MKRKKNEVWFKDRIEKELELLFMFNMSIREIAKEIGISKSAVHYDLRNRVTNLEDKEKIDRIFYIHEKTRSLKGGLMLQQRRRIEKEGL